MILTGKVELADCLSCPGGRYCGSQGLTNWTGDCSAGFYCTVNSTSDSPLDGVTGDECPPGHYCPVQSPAPVPCPDGKWCSRNSKDGGSNNNHNNMLSLFVRVKRKLGSNLKMCIEIISCKRL